MGLPVKDAVLIAAAFRITCFGSSVFRSELLARRHYNVGLFYCKFDHEMAFNVCIDNRAIFGRFCSKTLF